ncbi:uncharacterized protein NEPG_00875 [Nematocida parisii ERTm1]|uniref:uncharacterized protein n=1 Tax=Nematocida parisii (strain ERTm1 / ATCC PRA-289) TaxID=881290 RepID=UPI000264BA06|nr:uncharacterized protein NEPG_00875 [Nematocida parisii ERTm1]EIJ94208.1 hypothetical protein NEPG_00875 [Nematocida parisii ERTm1]|eukprot:XP_013058704.1 hypothetical protein NEPG_00875 [Nematocida parisii ERTm1]
MRIIVKNLPVTATKQDIKEHFSEKGVPTDVRLLSTMRGESRGIAFIGYKTEEESEASIVHYNRAYYNGNKLVVQKSESKEARNRTMQEDRPVKQQKAVIDGLEVGEMKEILKLLQAKKENVWSMTVDDESPEKEKKKRRRSHSRILLRSIEKQQRQKTKRK